MATLRQSLTHQLVVMHHSLSRRAGATAPSRPPPPPLRPIRQQRHPGPAYPPRRHLNSCASTRSSSNTRMKMPAGLLMSIPDFLGALRAITTSSGRRVVARYGSWGAKGGEIHGVGHATGTQRRSSGDGRARGQAGWADREGKPAHRTSVETFDQGRRARRAEKIDRLRPQVGGEVVSPRTSTPTATVS